MSLRIGFDRKLKLRWLDALADHMLQGAEPDAVRQFLDEMLDPDHAGHKARANTVTVLMRMWVNVPSDHRGLRDEALTMLPNASDAERVWIHWGMALLGFPLFRVTAATAGRLLNLQDDVRLAQIRRRLVEVFGQRSTLEYASQRVVSSMTDWGVLIRTADKGIFRRAPVAHMAVTDVQLWLLEAVLRGSGAQEMEATQLLGGPELFPFRLTVGVGDLRQNPRFVVHRQGLDMDVVALGGSAKG